MVKINYEHNHQLLTTGAWNFLGISESTKARYSQLFAEGNTPSKARLIYVAELKEKLGEDLFFKESAKRSINPGSGAVFNMWTKYVGRFGSANGPDSFVKACEEIEKVNSEAGEQIASIRQFCSSPSSLVLLQKTAFSHWSRVGFYQDHWLVSWLFPCRK